jgi:hypothetical protein
MKSYLTGFLNRTFSGEIGQNHGFCGGDIFKARLVYQPGIKHGATLRKSTPYLHGLTPPHREI